MESRTGGGYLRFGDGDVNLLWHESSLEQPPHDGLTVEMREAFSLVGPGIMKCLPLHSARFGMYDGMRPGHHGTEDEWAERFLYRCFEYFIGQPIYSMVALAYTAAVDAPFAVDFLRFLKSTRPVFTGNAGTPPHIVRALFGSTDHVAAPPRDAYAEIDRLERQTLDLVSKRGGYSVVAMAAGCGGRPLAKRLIKNGGDSLFVFDFGSLLDIFCGWKTRAWFDLTGRDRDYWDDLLAQVGKA
jgi:hypothetical protein